MTAAEFRHIRHALGLSAQGLARLLGVKSGRTIRHWEAGTNDIAGPARVLMALLARGVITPKDLA